MNQLAGKDWDSQARSTADLHRQHQARGVKVCQRIAEVMAGHFLTDEKMRHYYRPSTLFRPIHFDEYANTEPAKFKIKGPPPQQTDAKTVDRRFRLTCAGCKRSWERVKGVPEDLEHQATEFDRESVDHLFSDQIPPLTGEGDPCQCGIEFADNPPRVRVEGL
jgi:hypothetical protein